MTLRTALSPLLLLLALAAHADDDGPFYKEPYEESTLGKEQEQDKAYAASHDREFVFLPATLVLAGQSALTVAATRAQIAPVFINPYGYTGTLHERTLDEALSYRYGLSSADNLLLGIDHIAHDSSKTDYDGGTEVASSSGHKPLPSVGYERLFSDTDSAFQLSGALTLAHQNSGTGTFLLQPGLNAQLRISENLRAFGNALYSFPLSDRYDTVSSLGAGLEWRLLPRLGLALSRSESAYTAVRGQTGFTGSVQSLAAHVQFTHTQYLALAVADIHQGTETTAGWQYLGAKGTSVTAAYYYGF